MNLHPFRFPLPFHAFRPLVFLLALLNGPLHALPSVSNLTAGRKSGTSLVSIGYDLSAPGSPGVSVSLEVSSDNGATWNVPVLTVSGQVGNRVVPGLGKEILWDWGKDWPQGKITTMRFRVRVDDRAGDGSNLPQNFSYIPPGEFTMGRVGGDADADAPPVNLTVNGFYLQVKETTKAEWDLVRTWASENGYTDLAPGGGNGPDHPVQSVNWWDVVKWCNARSEMEGLTPCYNVAGAVLKSGTASPTVNWHANGYRMPTEAEWEKAARGGVSARRFPNGKDTIGVNEARFGGSESTVPAGSFPFNGFGLGDMAGNVGEWCWDWYQPAYYTVGATDPRGPASGVTRVVRGGSFESAAVSLRSSNRSASSSNTRSNATGFRPARGRLPSEFVEIPAGEFTMGRTSGDSDADAPPVTVNVSAFQMQRTETTKALWDEVRAWALLHGYPDLAPGGAKGPQHPVQSVSWRDAVKWCNARSEMEGLTPCYLVAGAVLRSGTAAPAVNWNANGYRLPTEAEWEKAARGGAEGRRFPWGTDTIGHDRANYYGSGASAYDQSPVNGFHPEHASGGQPYTAPSGSFATNGFGLHDVAGNVQEWCWDWYGGTAYAQAASDPRGPATGTTRVLRGGSWGTGAINARCAHRGSVAPGFQNSSTGFRTARGNAFNGFAGIPGGAFTLGRTSGDPDADAPPVLVGIDRFFLQRTETTKAQWDLVRDWALVNGYTDLAEGGGENPQHPVHSVNWWDVVKWCNARSEMEGLTPCYTVGGSVMRIGNMVPSVVWKANGYRLPTEAEWEKAARGGIAGKRFPWGTDSIDETLANYYAGRWFDYDQGGFTDPGTVAAGGFPGNAFGLSEMAGNVREWCWDWYGSNSYQASADNPRGPDSGANRVTRGGGWSDFAIRLRNAHRSSEGPGARNRLMGFRPALGGPRVEPRSIVSAQSPPLELDSRQAPAVSLPVATVISGTGANLGGQVTGDGGAPVTERGVVYSLGTVNFDPMIGGTGVVKIANPGTLGTFAVPVSGLIRGAGYSFKAYASNAIGTNYSAVSTFDTLPPDARLNGLELMGASLSPAFASGVFRYSAEVGFGMASASVRVFTEEDAPTIRVRVNGGTNQVVAANAWIPCPLNVGANRIEILITSRDRTKQRTYTLTVTRRAALPQAITFAPPRSVYRGDNRLILTGSASSGLPLSYRVVDGPATLSGTQLTFTGAGALTVEATQPGGGNFAPAAPVRRSILVHPDPATLTLTGLNPIYDGLPKPVTVRGGVPATVTYTVGGKETATPPVNAGSYPVRAVAGLRVQRATLVIARALVTVTPRDARKLIGQPNPVFSATYSGFRGSDNEGVLTQPPALTTKATDMSPGGNHPITASGASAANYRFTYRTGTLTIDSFAGRYEGLVSETGILPLGKLSILVTDRNNGFTARLNSVSEPGELSFRGTLEINAPNGRATGTAASKTNGAAYSISFSLPLDGPATMSVTRDDAPFGSTGNGRKLPALGNVPYRGTHTAILQPATPAGGPVPAGSGWATADIAANGTLTLTGKLADGTAFTTALAPDGQDNPGYRLFVQPYLPARAGSFLTGEFNLTPHPDLPDRRHLEASSLTWAKAARETDATYPAGFGAVVTSLGIDPWRPPVAATGSTPAVTLVQRLLGPTAATSLIDVAHSPTGSNSNADLPTVVQLGADNRVTVVAPLTNPINRTNWKVTFEPKRGTFTGSFELRDGPRKRVVPFSGVLRQAPGTSMDAVIGDGHYLMPPLNPASGGTRSGEILLQTPED